MSLLFTERDHEQVFGFGFLAVPRVRATMSKRRKRRGHFC